MRDRQSQSNAIGNRAGAPALVKSRKELWQDSFIKAVPGVDDLKGELGPARGGAQSGLYED